MSYLEIQQSYYNFLKNITELSAEKIIRGAPEAGTEFPYITYTVTATDFREEQPFIFNIYSKDKYRIELTDIAEKIQKSLPVFIEFENGYTVFEQGSPFIQDFDQNIDGVAIFGIQIALIASQVYVNE